VSDPDLEALRRSYTYNLSRANRCESCRHAEPLEEKVLTRHGKCRLLNIAIEDVRRSRCLGWQTTWGKIRQLTRELHSLV